MRKAAWIIILIFSNSTLFAQDIPIDTVVSYCNNVDRPHFIESIKSFGFNDSAVTEHHTVNYGYGNPSETSMIAIDWKGDRVSKFWYFTNNEEYYISTISHLVKLGYSLKSSSEHDGDETTMYFTKIRPGHMEPDSITMYHRKKGSHLHVCEYGFAFSTL